jgi:ABC-type phosphate/phosphonate transport system substrate-binding protein
MNRRNLFGFAPLFAALAIALAMPGATNAQPPPADAATIKLGMAKSFFNDLHPAIIKIATAPFSPLMKATTGLDGALSYDEDAFGTAAQLDANQLQFGVFHGHEFAWVQKKYPSLKPLMVVVNKQHDVRAYVIVHKDNPIKNMAGLRGKTFDVSEGLKEHCRIFMVRKCGDNAQNELKNYFGTTTKSKTTMGSMDQVARGKADVTVVDTISLAFYKDIKLAVFNNNLRVLEESEAFPAAVIAYKDGALKDATLKQFCDGLSTANKNADGKDMMQMWGIEGFEPVPATYTKSLADVLKLYPSPEPTKVGLR